MTLSNNKKTEYQLNINYYRGNGYTIPLFYCLYLSVLCLTNRLELIRLLISKTEHYVFRQQ